MAPISAIKAGKADVVSSTGGKSTQDLMAEVQARIDQIRATEKEQSAYLSSEDMADLEKMEALLQGSLTLLEQFEKTGALSMPADGMATESGLIPNSAALKTGWNGSFDAIEDDTGVYDQIIKPHNTGKDSKNGLIFKAQNGDEITGKNVGNDLEITVIQDGVEKKYLLMGMAKSTIPLVIAADQTTEGVTVNFAKAKLAGALTILGGSGDDTLIGSQGNDKIYGNAGIDTIYGMGGVNTLSGGADADILTGGSGKDTISGDAGYDSITKAKGDQPVDPEDVTEIETKAFDKSNFDKTKSKGWTASEKSDGSELVISKNSDAKDGGSITLTIPNGYMVYGKQEPNSDDLVLTLQQINDDGTPGDTQVVRLKGFLAANNQSTLNLISESEDGSPNMVDMGGIKSGFNKIDFKEGKGSDVFVPDETEFDSLGIDKNSLGKPSIMNEAAKEIKEEWMKNEEFKKQLKENSTTQSGGTITLTPNANTETLDIPSPDDYTKDSVTVVQADKDGKGYTVTMFIKNEKTGDTESLVIKVVKTGDNPQNILIDGQTVIEINE